MGGFLAVVACAALAREPDWDRWEPPPAETVTALDFPLRAEPADDEIWSVNLRPGILAELWPGGETVELPADRLRVVTLDGNRVRLVVRTELEEECYDSSWFTWFPWIELDDVVSASVLDGAFLTDESGYRYAWLPSGTVVERVDDGWRIREPAGGFHVRPGELDPARLGPVFRGEGPRPPLPPTTSQVEVAAPGLVDGEGRALLVPADPILDAVTRTWIVDATRRRGSSCEALRFHTRAVDGWRARSGRAVATAPILRGRATDCVPTEIPPIWESSCCGWSIWEIPGTHEVAVERGAALHGAPDEGVVAALVAVSYARLYVVEGEVARDGWTPVYARSPWGAVRVFARTADLSPVPSLEDLVGPSHEVQPQLPADDFDEYGMPIFDFTEP